MDLDEVDDAVTVWVARVRTREEPIVTAWSFRDKAEAWVAHELDVEQDAVAWRESGSSRPGVRVAGHFEGDIAGTIQQVEVMDPISLSRRYPTEMPGARHVLNDE
jgi:hypothetical protein